MFGVQISEQFPYIHLWCQKIYLFFVKCIISITLPSNRASFSNLKSVFRKVPLLQLQMCVFSQQSSITAFHKTANGNFLPYTMCTDSRSCAPAAVAARTVLPDWELGLCSSGGFVTKRVTAIPEIHICSCRLLKTTETFVRIYTLNPSFHSN